MAARTKTLYGVISVLVAVLVISSTLTAYYYAQYNQAQANNKNLQNELQNASSKYSSLASNYNGVVSSYDAAKSTYNGSVSSFEKLAAAFNSTSVSFLSISKEFNLTFSLLVSAVSALNTSDSAYVNASKLMTNLWTEYVGIEGQYAQVSSNFETILTNFDSGNNVTLQETIQPVSLSLLTSNVLIDFGNGTRDWFNSTAIQPQWNLYVTMLVITSGNVNATYYPSFGEHLVTGIDGVLNNNAQNDYWEIWTYNSTASWQPAAFGADLLPMYNGSVYAWAYCGPGVQTNSNCTAP